MLGGHLAACGERGGAADRELRHGGDAVRALAARVAQALRRAGVALLGRRRRRGLGHELGLLLGDFVAGQMRDRYTQSDDFDLAGLPPVRRDILPANRYLTSNVFEATRGCVHNCSFCVVPSAWGRRPWQKPVKEIVADIRRQKARRAIFLDLNLIADRDYAQRLFEALVPLGISWYGLSTTLLCEDTPLLDLAARSGCRGLLMGLESISDTALQQTQKAFNRPDRYANVVDELHRRGIALQGCFVFGLDEDTPDVFLETARLAVEIGIDLPRFAIITPFPGTPLYQDLDEAGRILTRRWELYDGQHVVFEPSQMTPAQLQQGNQDAWRYAYRWRNIARRVWQARRQRHVALIANLGYRFYAHRLHRFYTCDWPRMPEPAPGTSPTATADPIAVRSSHS